ncbi:MAG: adenylate/guanylate cyclase domain-containing protein [Pseudomonadota bacterium]
MTHVLWRGNWATRVRIVSGLVLMIYVTAHLLNIGAVLVSPDFADAVQDVRLAVTRTPMAIAVMTLAIVSHVVLSLAQVVQKRTLRMPLRDYLQIVLGLSIPLLLSSHVIFTAVAHTQLEVNTQIHYLVSRVWGGSYAWVQAAFVLVVWAHGVIGLHMWLRPTDWWQRNIPTLAVVGTLIPTLALLGYLDAGRRIADVLQGPEGWATMSALWNLPDRAGLGQLGRIDQTTDQVIIAALLALALVVAGRHILIALRKPIRVTYADGPSARAARGQTVLDASRSAGIDHAALCGGRGRCTTCRVHILEGAEHIPPPSAAEARSLAAVGAGPETRLACQLVPTGPVTVARVFGADGKRRRAHARSGIEARLAVLFLDMRGFTARTDGQLPYDVVFLLNRFFDEIVPPITAAGGTVDKYMGDGLMAVFETNTARASALAAINAIQGIGEALRAFNDTLDAEGSAPVAIGVGVHLGNVVLGEIGAAGQAPRTLIGDTVNIASRLESETKAQGVEALISEDTLTAAGIEMAADALMPLTLRGRDAPLCALPLPQADRARETVAL